MSHVPRLRWRRQGDNAELLFSLEAEGSKLLTAYVVDGPALSRRDLRDRFVDLLGKVHDGWNRPAAVFPLGYAGLPTLTLGLAGRRDDRDRRLNHLERLLVDAPAYGRWWEPTATAIAHLWRPLPDHALCVTLLLAEGSPLPWEWDDCPLRRSETTEPAVQDSLQQGLPTVRIVRREAGALDTGNAETLDWEVFLDQMDVLARQRVDGAAGLFRFSIPFNRQQVPGMRLHDMAAGQGWKMVTEADDRLVIAHPALRLLPTSNASVLAVMPNAGPRLMDLPLPPFRLAGHLRRDRPNPATPVIPTSLCN